MCAHHAGYDSDDLGLGVPGRAGGLGHELRSCIRRHRRLRPGVAPQHRP
jgi:hypothetical protein